MYNCLVQNFIIYMFASFPHNVNKHKYYFLPYIRNKHTYTFVCPIMKTYLDTEMTIYINNCFLRNFIYIYLSSA